jgi:hypothetical protein
MSGVRKRWLPGARGDSSCPLKPPSNGLIHVYAKESAVGTAEVNGRRQCRPGGGALTPARIHLQNVAVERCAHDKEFQTFCHRLDLGGGFLDPEARSVQPQLRARRDQQACLHRVGARRVLIDGAFIVWRDVLECLVKRLPGFAVCVGRCAKLGMPERQIRPQVPII